MSLLIRVLLSVLLLAPAIAQAAAGQVLFALGRVEIQRGTQVLPAARGGVVEAGDVISTGPTGMTQVRMQDGALLSLRHGSTMKIEEYQAPAPVVAAPAGAAPAAPASGGRSVLRLLRGAFRTVTGLIGRNAGDTYSVVTPVATIGIRGTDYSAAYCNGDCGTTPDGLYLGVSNGGIEVSNDAGKLELANDQYGYVKDNASAPGRELAPPDVLDAPTPTEGDGDEEGERDETKADEGVADAGLRDDTRDESTYETGQTPPDSVGEARAVSGRYAFSSGSFKDVDQATVYIDGRGDLIGFSGGVAADIGTAANFDTGADSTTGLRWGRWHGGVANTASGGSTGGLDLRNASLHWIYAVGADGPVLAITGSRNYTLVGGTNPTDNSGAVGVLGGATLFADFTNQLVNTSVDVTMPNAAGGTTQWQAFGQGSIASGTFQGAYSSVTISGSTGGSGGFGGFFTADGSGAGLTFELTDASSTTINGVAAFAESTANPAGGP